MDKQQIRAALDEYAARYLPTNPDLWPVIRRRARPRRRRFASPASPSLARPHSRPRLTLSLSAAVLALAILAGILWAARPQGASAQALLVRAAAANATLTGGGARSFTLTLRERTGSGMTTPVEFATTWWYRDPTHWRTEVRAASGPDGVSQPARTAISDGTDLWEYDGLPDAVFVQRSIAGPAAVARVTPFAGQGGDLATLLHEAGRCNATKILGEESVANRPTLVIDLGDAKCRGVGRGRLWIDKETAFVLKALRDDGSPNQGDALLSATEVTSIAYDVPLDPTLFAFTPPPGARVFDRRPKPAPSSGEYARQLAVWAGQLDFPLFAPRNIPAGLVPQDPRLGPSAGIQIELNYLSPAEVATGRSFTSDGLAITERRSTERDIADLTNPDGAGNLPPEGRAEPVAVAGSQQAWLQRGHRNPDGSNSGANLFLLRDGTLIMLFSAGLTPEELLRIAASLEAVSGR